MSRVRNEQLIKAFGAHVRKLRLGQGLTMEQLATRAGIDYRQVARVELGEMNSSISMAERIAKGLGMTLGELFGGIKL